MNSAQFIREILVPSGWGRRSSQASVSQAVVAAASLFGAALVAQAQPIIDSFLPIAGMPGDQIQVTGSGFVPGTTKVYFWNGVLAATTVTSSTTLITTVPSGASTGSLAVQVGSGSRTYTADDFTVIGAGPYITDFLPGAGDSNTLVVINGVHFAGLGRNGVRFNGVPSTDAGVNALGTQINVHPPPGAPPGTGPINVTTAYGSSNSPTPFVLIGPGPYVTDFSPNHGTPGTTVLLNGVHFTSATNALFNGVPGVNFFATEIQIHVDAPAGVTSGPITVNSPLGSFTTSAYFFVPPTISSLSPTSGRPDTNVLVKGANFLGATAVKFSGTQAAFTNVDNNTITTTVPAGATSGSLQVVISTNFSCSSNFTILPTIYGFSPVFGRAGTNVTLTGANFNAGTPVVRFNGALSPQVSGVTFGQLTAVVPASATTGPISITTADGSHTNVNNFFLPASINSFTPTNSAPSTEVTLTGLNFLGATGVGFNGAAAAFVVSNNSLIRATVPANVTTGPLTVTTPAGTASSAGLFYGAPVISTFAPLSGTPGTNVTISGTNFLGATAVRFSGASATFSISDNGKIVAVAPATVQTGPITVEAPAGTNTSTASFVVDYPSDLEVWLTDSPDPVSATSNLVFAVTMINHGPFDAPNVRLTNTLPASVIFVSASMPPPWTVVTNGNLVVASSTNVAVGGSSTLTVTARPQVGGPIITTASIGSDRVDPSLANNVAAITTTVVPLPVLSIRWWTNQVNVSWPVALSNYVLESKVGSLTNVTWAAVTNVPAISGTQNSVVESNTAPAKYYRLRR